MAIIDQLASLAARVEEAQGRLAAFRADIVDVGTVTQEMLMQVDASISTVVDTSFPRAKESMVDMNEGLVGLDGVLWEFNGKLETWSYGVLQKFDETKQGGATRMDDLLREMDRLAADGNAWAEHLVGRIHGVKEGVVDARDVIFAFGDGLIEFEGKITSIKDVLLDVLPTTGQVQTALVDLRREIETASLPELMERLRQQHNSYAQEFALLLKDWQAGRATLEAVIRAAQEIKQTLPGSESDALANELLRRHRAGDL